MERARVDPWGGGGQSLGKQRARLPQTPCLLYPGAPPALLSCPRRGHRRTLGRDYFHIPPLHQ